MYPSYICAIIFLLKSRDAVHSLVTPSHIKIPHNSFFSCNKELTVAIFNELRVSFNYKGTNL